MTNTTILYNGTFSTTRAHARPTGVDRLVMRLSLAMLRWARTHADRSMLSWDDRSLRHVNEEDRARREHEFSMGVLRIF